MTIVIPFLFPTNQNVRIKAFWYTKYFVIFNQTSLNYNIMVSKMTKFTIPSLFLALIKKRKDSTSENFKGMTNKIVAFLIQQTGIHF